MLTALAALGDAPALRRTPGAPAQRPDATLALRDLAVARPRLTGADRQAADRILARPTDGGGDPYGDGYATSSSARCSTHFCVHYVTRGADAPVSGGVTATLRVLEEVWKHHVDRYGYRRPISDGNRGGNSKFDVYLKDVGAKGLYGYCAPERQVLGEPKQADSYCVLDDDFSRSQFGRDPGASLRVTAAHEFFHAIQFAYDYLEDGWLLESTATWIEERYADSANDNRSYLRYGQLGRPQVPLDVFEDGGFAHYGNWLFWEYLSRRYGVSIVRLVWNQAGTGGSLPDDYSTRALVAVLRSRGGVPANFAAYAGGNVVPARTYSEGSAYRAVPSTERRLTSSSRSASVETRLNHLSSRAYRFVPDRSLASGSRVSVSVNGPDRLRAPAAYLVTKLVDGTVRQRPIALGSTGNGTIEVAFDRSVSWVTIVLANASTRFSCNRGTSYSCEGKSYDDSQLYAMRAVVTR